jgi:predicted transcriptional regulator
LKRSRTPVELAYEILKYIKYNKASKWDLIKIVGNNRQFNHWVTGFLVYDGFVKEPNEDSEFFSLTTEGEILLSLLKKGNLMSSLFKLNGRRLRN